MINLKTYISVVNDVIGLEESKYIYLDDEKTDYLIHRDGYVISMKPSKRNGDIIPHKLKNNIMDSGYNVVCLYHNGKEYWRYVHRLVACAFIPIPDKYIKLGLTEKDLEVNHINGTFEGKSDNSVTNLEWVTSSDNKFHAYKHKLKHSCEKCPASKYNNLQIIQVCELLEKNKLGNRDIWKKTGVSVDTIQVILAGKQWKDISCKYDFSKHKKRHILYPDHVKEKAKDLLKNSELSFKDIGDIIGMTRNAVWFVNKENQIRK